MPKLFYWQKLPHFFPPGGTYFITYRLAGSAPKEKIALIEAEREAAIMKFVKPGDKVNDLSKEDIYQLYFEKIDFCVDTNLNEPYWLQQDAAAKIIADSLHFLSQSDVKLWAFCIMPNHVHVLFDTKKLEADVVKIMQQHKSFTAKLCNKILSRGGQFWERESYDHVVRNGKFDSTVNYILNNPVKAGFVINWKDWKWSYINPALL
jgi:putative transposase